MQAKVSAAAHLRKVFWQVSVTKATFWSELKIRWKKKKIIAVYMIFVPITAQQTPCLAEVKVPRIKLNEKNCLEFIIYLVCTFTQTNCVQ